MTEVLRFDDFIDTNYLSELDDFNEEVINRTSNKLLDEYKEIAVTQIIRQFGLSDLLSAYKDGGNVTTLHNAQKQVFANENDQERFNKKYDRKDYESNVYDKNGELERAGLSTLRERAWKSRKDQVDLGSKVIKVKNENQSLTEKNKKIKKVSNEGQEQIKKFVKKTIDNNGEIIDGYNSDLRYKYKETEVHVDHTVSSKELHGRDDARLFMTDDERSKLALDEKNLNMTQGSANQSKSDRDLSEWAESTSKKHPDKTNQDRFNLNSKEIEEKNRIARENVEKKVKKERRNYYAKNTAKTSAKQGLEMGMNQALGILMYELQYELTIEMKKYFRNFKSYEGIEMKLKELKNCFGNVKDNLIKKSKKILEGFSTGFISGFISNILTIIVNTFITTTKRWVKIITEGFTGLVQSVKILFSNSEDNSEDSKEKFKAATKVFTTTVLATLGGLMTESLITYLGTTPFAAFATPIGLVVGGILTGLVTVTVMYLMDDYKQVLESFKNMFKKSENSQEELIEIYNNIMDKMEKDYLLILRKMYNQYKRLHQITVDAFDQSLHFNNRFDNTIVYAETMEVNRDKIVRNEDDIDEFFL